MVMGHEEIREKLSAYMDGEITPSEEQAIVSHLGECPDCARELAELRRTLELLKGVPKVEPPPWFATRIMARVREVAEPQQTLWQRFFSPFRLKLALEVMALLLVCVTGWYLARTNEPLLQPSASRTEQGVKMEKGEAPPQPPDVNMEQTPVAPTAAGGRKGVVEQKPAEPAPVTDRPKTDQRFAAPPPSSAEPHAPAPPVRIESSPAIKEEERFTPAPQGAGALSERPLLRMQEAPPSHADENLSPAPAAPAKSYNKGMDATGAGAVRKGKKEAKRAVPGYAPQKSMEHVKTTVQLRIKEPATAVEDIERAVIPLGGRLLQRTTNDEPTRLTLRLPASSMPEFLERLARIATIVKKSPFPEGYEGDLEIAICW